MSVIECPLCCAEAFPSIYALENHLLDLCENICCPLCEVTFSTIKSLAVHLRQGCSKSSAQNDLAEELEDSSKNDESIPSSNGNLVYCIAADINSLNGVPEDNSTILVSKDSLNVNSFIDLEQENVKTDCIQHNEFIKNSDVLYCCSVCDMTFSSIEEHLGKFHLDENVVVDNGPNLQILNEVGHVDPNHSPQEEIPLSEVELLPSNAGSVLLTSEDVNSLLIVSLGPHNYTIEKVNTIENTSENNTSMSLENEQPKSPWTLDGNCYYYSSSFDKHNVDTATRNVFHLLNNDNWPSSLINYPVATLISVREKTFSETDSLKNKLYLLNGHRVRLLEMAWADGAPRLEDIPFTDKPPDTLIPVLEKTTVSHKDLAGTYSVMWPCRLCGDLAYHWSDLAKHSCSSSTKYFPCTICKETFRSRRQLNAHFSVTHNVLGSLSTCLLCPLCPAKLHTASHLEKHLSMHKENDLVKCGVCDSMVQRSTFVRHLKAHEKYGSLSLVCQSCNRSFRGKAELNIHKPQCHLQLNEEDSLKCVDCRKLFPNLELLREHMTSHDVLIKKHLCSFCPKSYHRLIDKVVHERVHTRSKPHSCNECGRCFRLRNALIAHMRIHSGEKPFKCSSCDKKFRTKNLLRSHVPIHSGGHIFKCKDCKKNFRSKEKLLSHESHHKKPIVCNECQRTFYSFSFAQKHMNNHKNNELNFTCNLCPNMFTRAAYFESHLRMTHGLDTITSISISTQKTYKDMEKSVMESQ